jgi:hypothetical protein
MGEIAGLGSKSPYTDSYALHIRILAVVIAILFCVYCGRHLKAQADNHCRKPMVMNFKGIFRVI